MLLDGFEGRNDPGRVVGAEEVPCVKAGEVLKGTEDLIAANCGEELVLAMDQRV